MEILRNKNCLMRMQPETEALIRSDSLSGTGILTHEQIPVPYVSGSLTTQPNEQTSFDKNCTSKCLQKIYRNCTLFRYHRLVIYYPMVRS